MKLAEWACREGLNMPPRNNNHLVKALHLARQMNLLADRGEAHCQDDGCAVVFGVIRDCAYKIRGTAEREKEAHKMRGLWDPPEGGQS
jgi:hypothetical protein